MRVLATVAAIGAILSLFKAAVCLASVNSERQHEKGKCQNILKLIDLLCDMTTPFFFFSGIFSGLGSSDSVSDSKQFVYEKQRYDGWFNNMAHPEWGTVGIVYT